MAATMGGEKKSEADLVAEAQGKQDEEIDKAIAGAFESTEERLTVDRIDLLKNILNDIVDAQKKSKEKKRAFELRAALESALKKHETVIGKIENKELEVFLKILNAEIKKDDVAAVSQDGGLEVKERTEVKSNQELEAAGLGASDLSEKLILNIDKFLEEKKRDKIRNDLGSRDKNVGDDFDVAVGTILEDPRTAEAHANRYKNSFAIRLGGYLAAAGIGMVIAAGSVAASVATAGVFPIAIAAVGGLLIVGAGLYYAKKKRDRIGDFLPSQYNQAKLSRQALITQLDGEERVEKAARLAEKYDKQNAKNKKLAKQKITDYEKKHNADYNRTCDKIDEFQTELDTINEILEPSFSMNFEQLKKECLSDDSNAYNCVLMSPPATFDKTRDKKSVYLVKNELDEDYVAHYYNGIRWCQARRNGSAVDKLLNSGKTQWYSASDIKEITSMYGCTHFKHMKAFENINKEGKFVDLADFRNHLRDRGRQINYGKYGSKEFDEELKNIKDALKDNSITDVDAFKKKYEKILPNSGNYKRIGSCKRYLIQRSKKLEERREGSLVQLKELKKKYDDSLKELQTKVSTNLDKEDRENIARRTEDSCLLESYDPLEKKKSIELTWYKKIMPYFAYWGTCIYLNVRSTAEAGTVFVDAVQEGVAQTQEKLQKDGKDPLSIKELQDVAAVAQRLEDARDQFEKRITEITTGLNLKFSESDFSNYLKIEKCYASRKTYREKIARLISGDKIKSIMLNIFYTHPSTVLSVLGKNSDVTTKNINTVLNNAKKNLSGFSEKLITLNSLQIYFTRDENENTNYKSFMLVSSEVPGEAKNQEALFEHILLIKQSIMEVNKTLLAASKVGQLDLVIVGVKGTVADLISAAKPIAAEIEKQLEKLDVAEESLQYREAYINVFSGFSTADKLDDFMKNAENNAENLAGIILILNNKKLKAFADHIKDSNLTLEDGILKEFYDLFSRDEKTLKQDEKTLKQEKFKFFQRIKAVGKNDKQLDLLQQMYQEFCEGESFDVKDLQKLDGYPIQDLKKYIKNNEHAYRSERVLIDQKRGVLEEMQKSLVLSIPEIEETLGLEPTHEFRRIAKKRGINNYGIPYNPKISLSMDYIRNLFKSTEFAFGKMKDILFDLKFPEMTISSIDFSLGEIFKVVSDKRIPGTIESAFKFLNKIKFIIPGFDLTFGSLFDTMEKDTAVLNRENQKKVVDAIAGLRTFLGGIPDPFKGMTFPDLVLEIGRMSLEIKRLSFRLTELDPRNVRDALEMKDIILRLNMLKINFNKLNVSLGSIDLKGLVRDLPDRFPCKAALSDFVVKFDPFFDGLKKMSKRFGKLELGKFPLDDFLYICNCYPEFEKFGGFGKLVVQFPAWLKEYADLDKKIKALEKEEAEGGYNPFSLLGDYRIKLGEIKINLEKFRKFNMCLGKVAEFSSVSLPEFLTLPELPGLSLGNLQGLSIELKKFGEISFDDISVLINFLRDFGNIKGLNLKLDNLQELIAGLTFSIKSLKGSDSEKLAQLKSDLKEATRQLEMFKNLNLHIEKLSLILPTIPGLPGPFNFSKLTGALKGFDTGLKGISFSIDLYSWKNDIKNAFSDVDLRVDIKSLWPTFPLDIEPLWPSFRQAKDKNKANQGDVFSKFNLDFGDVNIKAPDLDEIIRRVEQLRDFNDATKLRIDAEIKTALTHEFSGVVKDATGLTDTQISEVTGKIDEVYKEAKLGLEVTLISLYTLKATIAVVNAIKRGDGTVGTELEELLKKIPILQSEIKLIVDELKMLKEFGSKADLETIELLKKKLASKTQDLKSVKLNLFELKRMGEAFKALSDPRIVVDYKKPPLSDMLSGIKTENVKTIIDGANVVIRQAGKLSVAAIDSAVLAIELSETTATLVPLVDVIQNIDRKNIKSELEELIKEASKPVEKIAAENVKSELLKLNDTKKRLLELKDLSKRASEIPNLDFTHSTYSTVLQPLGLSGDMVTSFVKNAKEMSSKDIDAALSKLAIAEQPLKLGLLAKNIAVMEKAKPLLEFLKQPSTGGSNSDRIFQEWNSRAGAGEEPLDFFALRDAVKSVESLVNELEHPSFKVASPLITSEMEGIKEKLNGLVGNTDKQKAKQLFSSIYDFANAAAIAAVKAKAAALRIELKMDDVRYVSKAAPKPGALIEEHKKAMSDFVTHTEKLMRKFEAYRSLVRISNELKTKEVGNVTSSEFEAFEDFRRKAMGLEEDIKIFKLKKHELKMVPVSENKSDAPLVPVSEKKGDDPFDFDLLGENDSAENVSNSFAPRVAENSAANSPETVEVKKLKALLGVLDNLYSLNSAQDIHQKLESAESLFDVLKANEDRKPMPHSKAVMFMGPAGPENKVQVEAGSELNPDDLTQQKPGAPPRSTPT